jgi:hypothetical protein
MVPVSAAAVPLWLGVPLMVTVVPLWLTLRPGTVVCTARTGKVTTEGASAISETLNRRKLRKYIIGNLGFMIRLGCS